MFDSGGLEVAGEQPPDSDPPFEPWNRPSSAVVPDGYAALELQDATRDPADLTDAEVVEAVRAYDHVVSWAGAQQARMLAEFARRRPPDRADPVDRPTVGAVSAWAPDEIGLALTLSRGTASDRIDRSVRLAAVLAATLAAWRAGRLDQAKVNAIHDATVCLSDEAARVVQDRVLPRAPLQTVGQLRAALERAVIAVDPAGADARHRQAYRSRRVAVNADRDGMASLWALLSAPDALTCYGWLTALARGLPSCDPRSMDARRADLLVQLLTGHLALRPDPADPAGAAGANSETGAAETGAAETATESAETATESAESAESAPAGSAVTETVSGKGRVDQLPAPLAAAKPLVHVVVPLTTLTGADDSPVELTGYGPLPPELGRAVAADGVWKRLLTDPVTGAVLDVGRSSYRPPAALAEFLRARDRTCRVPICRRRALDSQIDHTVAFHAQGGTTERANLYHACLCHHRMKDAPGWRVTQGSDGLITWTTPTGHRYSSMPTDYRPEPDLAAVVAALDHTAAARTEARPPGKRPRGSPFDRPDPPEDPDHPPPF